MTKNEFNDTSSLESSFNVGYECPGCIEPGKSLTRVSLPGIYRIILPEKKRVFFGESAGSVWLEIAFLFDLMESGNFPDCELLRDYREPSLTHASSKFRCLVLESHAKFRDPLKRQETLNKLKGEFLQNYPSYGLYEVPPF